MQRITDSYLKKLKGEDVEQLVLVDTCLYLRVTKSHHGHTAKKWLLRFKNDGKIQKFVFGQYPEIGLADAKARAIELLARARQGENLVQTKKQSTTNHAETFGDITKKWLATKNWSPAHLERQVQRLENNALRVFGDIPVNAVSIEHVDRAISHIVQRGAMEYAYRNLIIIRDILKYADSLDKLGDSRILAKLDAYKRNVPKPKARKHFYSPMSEDEISELLKRIAGYVSNCRIESSVALRVLPYLLCRPIELCGAMWKEIDFETAEWRIPAQRMKMSRDHIVPLPTQALDLFEEIRSHTQRNAYCFPSWSKSENVPHITTNSLIMAFRRMGYVSTKSTYGFPFTPHGFRGMGSTILYQTMNYPGHLIELQLAHIDSNKVRAAYNQITARSWLDERRKMLQEYANYLDTLRDRQN